MGFAVMAQRRGEFLQLEMLEQLAGLKDELQTALDALHEHAF